MIRSAKFQTILLAVMLSGTALLAQETPVPPTPPTPPTPPSSYQITDQSKTSYLGVMVNDITPDRVSALKLKDDSGLEVTEVDHDGPAFKAGIKEHDVILQFNGSKVESFEELKRLIRETPPGRKVTLGIMRDGQPMNVDVTLTTRKQVYTVVKPFVPHPIIIPPVHVDVNNMWVVYGSRAGAQVENLSAQLGEYFGAKDGNGVLVRSVDEDSAAARAGLKAGDVIIKAGDTKISDQGDWRNALRDNRGKKMPITILRDRHEQVLTLDVPGRESSENSFEIDVPTIDQDQMKALQDQLAALQVEAKNTTSIELRKQQAEVARAMREAQRELQRELRDMQREMRREQKEQRKQSRESQKEQDEDQP